MTAAEHALLSLYIQVHEPIKDAVARESVWVQNAMPRSCTRLGVYACG